MSGVGSVTLFAVAFPPPHPSLVRVPKVEPAVAVNNNNNNNPSAFQSRTPNGHPYPARQRAALQHMQAGGRGESFLLLSSVHRLSEE